MTRSGLDRATAALLWAALVLAALHHADHVLRVDHSGWPFRATVTPFTYSLAARGARAIACVTRQWTTPNAWAAC